jgi:hypothetical protein
MLNIFTATGHNNYAKACRLYLQSMEEMQKGFMFDVSTLMFEQFILGNHTVRHFAKTRAGN